MKTIFFLFFFFFTFSYSFYSSFFFSSSIQWKLKSSFTLVPASNVWGWWVEGGGG